MNKKYTYSSIIPLIGGLPLGVMDALKGQLPEEVLSWKPFEANDSHHIEYLRNVKNWKGDYTFLDESPNHKPKQVDIVNSTCPCAGLSALSVTSNADSEINEWMYTSAEYVLSQVKPKVFFGENAPALYTKKGEKVRMKLHEIGLKYGYSLNVYFTESRVHGLCQKRPRSFYFFTKGDKGVEFPYWKKEVEPIEAILQKPVSEDDPMNILVNNNNPNEDPLVKFALDKTRTSNVSDFFNVIENSVNLVTNIEKEGGFAEAANWFEERGYDKNAKRCRVIQKKLDANLNYWGHGLMVGKGIIPSFVAVLPHSLINPYTQKFLTIRECLRIMKMPEDMILCGDKPERVINHICQNVPVSTAADVASGVLSFLDGKCKAIPSTIVMQNNKKREIQGIKENSNTIEKFFV
jgi:site-specific DNA-cytosine methylase